MEDKKYIVDRLKWLLKETRMGSDIADLVLDEGQTQVTILFKSGYKKEVDIAADSGGAIIKDIINSL